METKKPLKNKKATIVKIFKMKEEIEMKIKKIIKIIILIIIAILTFCLIMKNFFPAEWSFITPHKQGDFVRVGDMHHSVCRHQMILLDDGRVFVYKNGRIEIYNPKTRRFKNLGVKIQGLRDTSTAIKLKDGRIMIFRGFLAKKNYSSPETFFFDPKTEKVTQGPNMTIGRVDHSAALLNDGRVWISGGFYAHKGGCIYLKSTEFYNPVTNTFENGPELPEEIYEHKVIKDNEGNILLVGGFKYIKDTSANIIDPYNYNILTFNPKLNNVKKIGHLIYGRRGHDIFYIAPNKIYIAEGVGPEKYPNSNDINFYAKLFSIEFFNSDSKKSSIINKRTSPAEFITTALLPDNTILFSGGFSGFSIGYTKSSNTQIYDSRSNKFITPKNNSQNPIAKGTSIMLKDGNILMTGGGIDGSKKAAIYMFNNKIKK